MTHFDIEVDWEAFARVVGIALLLLIGWWLYVLGTVRLILARIERQNARADRKRARVMLAEAAQMRADTNEVREFLAASWGGSRWGRGKAEPRVS